MGSTASWVVEGSDPGGCHAEDNVAHAAEGGSDEVEEEGLAGAPGRVQEVEVGLGSRP